MLHKKQFCVETKSFYVAQKVMRCRPNQVDVAQKSVLRQQKIIHVDKNKMKKNILCAEKSY